MYIVMHVAEMGRHFRLLLKKKSIHRVMFQLHSRQLAQTNNNILF
jgi:hypothetical protein